MNLKLITFIALFLALTLNVVVNADETTEAESTDISTDSSSDIPTETTPKPTAKTTVKTKAKTTTKTTPKTTTKTTTKKTAKTTPKTTPETPSDKPLKSSAEEGEGGDSILQASIIITKTMAKTTPKTTAKTRPKTTSKIPSETTSETPSDNTLKSSAEEAEADDAILQAFKEMAKTTPKTRLKTTPKKRPKTTSETPSDKPLKLSAEEEAEAEDAILQAFKEMTKTTPKTTLKTTPKTRPKTTSKMPFKTTSETPSETSETTSETPSETTAETDKPLKSSAEEVEGEEEDEDDSLLQASKGGDGDAVNMKTCGITRKKSGNIVGGEKAAEAEFPWIVSFQRPKGDGMIHFCGGSIINERWLLSAAHCFQGVTNSFPKMKAVVGTIKWADPKAPKYTLEKLFNHEAYDENVYANDISLIKVKETIAMTSTKTHYTVNSVCVPTPDVKPTETATVYGWGYLKEEGDPSADLMKVTVNRSDTIECNKVYQEFVGNFTPEMFCFLSPGKDACKGDSGGPLTQTIKRKGTQLGVVSFGHGCARPKTPGIYQEVAKFYPWIEKTIKANP